MLSDQSRKSRCDRCSATPVHLPRFHLNTNRAADRFGQEHQDHVFGIALLRFWSFNNLTHRFYCRRQSHFHSVLGNGIIQLFESMINSLGRLTLRFGQIELPKNTMAVFIWGCCKEGVLTHSCPRFIYDPDNSPGRTYSFPDRLTQPDGCAKTSQKNQECKMSLVNLLNRSRTTCPTVLSTHCCDTLGINTT